jgi:hypothetical protein
MAQVVSMVVTARNGAQAAYIVRSRAQQRGVEILTLEVAESGPGAWSVSVSVDDADAARVVAAALDEDTQVLHLRAHPSRSQRDQG